MMSQSYKIVAGKRFYVKPMLLTSLMPVKFGVFRCFISLNVVGKSFLIWKIDAKIEKRTNLRRSHDDLKMTKSKIRSRYDTAQSIIFKTPCRRSLYLFWFSRYKILRFFAKEIVKFKLKTVIR